VEVKNDKKKRMLPLIVKFIIDKNGCCLNDLSKKFSTRYNEKTENIIDNKTLKTYLKHLMDVEHIFCYEGCERVNFEKKSFSHYKFQFNSKKENIYQYPMIEKELSVNLQNAEHQILKQVETTNFPHIYFSKLIENNIKIKYTFTPGTPEKSFKIYLRDNSNELFQKLAVAIIHDCFLSPRESWYPLLKLDNNFRIDINIGIEFPKKSDIINKTIIKLASKNKYPPNYKNMLNTIYERIEKGTNIEIRDDNQEETLKSSYNLALGEQTERQIKRQTEKQTKYLQKLKEIMQLDDEDLMADIKLIDYDANKKLVDIGLIYEKFGIKDKKSKSLK